MHYFQKWLIKDVQQIITYGLFCLFVYLFLFVLLFASLLLPLPMQSAHLYNFLHVCIYTFQHFLFYFEKSKSCIFHSSLILFYYSVWLLWSIFLLCAFWHINTLTNMISASPIYSQESIAKNCTLQCRNVQTLQNLLHLPSFWISIRSNLG